MGGSQAICMAACADGKTFDIINSKAYVKYMWNCNKADFGIERMPDCVGKHCLLIPCIPRCKFTHSKSVGSFCPKMILVTKQIKGNSSC